MKLPIAYYGDPILRKKTLKIDAITDEIRQLVADMEETMHAHNGIGLAAPQVHHSLALFITYANEYIDNPIPDAPKPLLRIFINPKILEYSEEVWERGEGCLSIPKVYGTVYRPVTIKIEATDLEGNKFTETFSDLPARAIMHENDHLNGVLFIDRLDKKERKEIESDLKKLKQKFTKK